MEYQLALPPDLGLSPADFVAAWNASSEYRAIAQASLSSSTSAQYDPLLVGTLAVLSSVGIGPQTDARLLKNSELMSLYRNKFVIQAKLL